MTSYKVRSSACGKRWALWSVFVALGAGCAGGQNGLPRAGPARPALVQIVPWAFPGSADGHAVRTAHYTIYTTIEEEGIVESLGQLMEGAFEQYQHLTPTVAPTAAPLPCYVFATRRQWAQFTQGETGTDAQIYLRINRGGYTVRDWYVAYFIGDVGTYSVASHEGWHQYVVRHFKSRPPPFLEEGIACTFEDVTWEKHLPRWTYLGNIHRLEALQRARQKNMLIPLSELCRMHAGQVVDTTAARVEAFYAQCWAFARFCREADGGTYRPALEKCLATSPSARLIRRQSLRRPVLQPSRSGVRQGRRLRPRGRKAAGIGTRTTPSPSWNAISATVSRAWTHVTVPSSIGWSRIAPCLKPPLEHAGRASPRELSRKRPRERPWARVKSTTSQNFFLGYTWRSR